MWIIHILRYRFKKKKNQIYLPSLPVSMYCTRFQGRSSPRPRRDRRGIIIQHSTQMKKKKTEVVVSATIPTLFLSIAFRSRTTRPIPTLIITFHPRPTQFNTYINRYKGEKETVSPFSKKKKGEKRKILKVAIKHYRLLPREQLAPPPPNTPARSERLLLSIVCLCLPSSLSDIHHISVLPTSLFRSFLIWGPDTDPDLNIYLRNVCTVRCSTSSSYLHHRSLRHITWAY